MAQSEPHSPWPEAIWAVNHFGFNLVDHRFYGYRQRLVPGCQDPPSRGRWRPTFTLGYTYEDGGEAAAAPAHG